MLDPHLVWCSLDRGRDADADHLLPANTFADAGSMGSVRSCNRLIVEYRRCARRRRRHRRRTRRCQTRRTYATRRAQNVDQRRQILLPVVQRSLAYRIEAHDIVAAARLRPRYRDRSTTARISRYSIDRRLVLMRLGGRAVTRRCSRVLTAPETPASLRRRRHGAVYKDRQKFCTGENIVLLRWSASRLLPDQSRLKYYLKDTLYYLILQFKSCLKYLFHNRTKYMCFIKIYKSYRMYNNGRILSAEDIHDRILALMEFNGRLYIFFVILILNILK